MKNVEWPFDLPQFPSLAGYTHITPNNTIRTTMEYGPAKTRRRTSSAPSERNLNYVLLEEARLNDRTINQKDLFLEFYEVVDCNISFWLPDPENPAQAVKVRIKGNEEEGAVSLLPLAPGVWSATFKVEVWPHACKSRIEQ